jgi:argininosuccinate synthase
MDKVILAYSGGLDTSITIPWLKETYGYEVIAMAADLGQGEELEPLREKALMSGASKVYIEDVREEFVTDFIYPILKAGAIYEGKYLLGTSAARPLIAKYLVEIARQEGAVAVVHGATGKGNDQVRFELSIKALNPHLKVIAPWREWYIKSREQAVDYAKARGIPVPVTKERPYSIDRNLWHLSCEGADLEDPWNAPQEDLYMMAVSPLKAPDSPAFVQVDFARGVPVALDGVAYAPVELLEKLNAFAGAHGIGIVDMVENRLVGMKSRGIYETPGGTLLHTVHQALEHLTLDRAMLHYKELVAHKYAELVYDGMWFSPLREALDAFVEVTQRTVTGSVRLQLYKGNCILAGTKSDYSLYSQEYATFAEGEDFNHKDAEGFINLFGLPLKIRALMEMSREDNR